MKNKEASCIACVLFETYNGEPFGSFVFYIAVRDTYNVNKVLNCFGTNCKFAFPSLLEIGLNGIATKLMNLVQFISWVLVRSTNLCFCATKNSQEFYSRLGLWNIVSPRMQTLIFQNELKITIT